jgi:hypothetical protein
MKLRTTELASDLLPIALILQILIMYQKDYLYKRLSPGVNHMLVALYIGICLYAFFARSDMVVNPGWGQVADTLLVAIACWGMTCAIFGRFVRSRGSNVMLRAALALASFLVLLHPDGSVALAAAVFVLPATIYGVKRHRRIAPPVSGLQSQPAN